ncbi:MAG: hypothetical protein JKY96_00965 [Phycisphaerales bacterium]|nr:hypothetical protein [Phycisphaerales bacterium]
MQDELVHTIVTSDNAVPIILFAIGGLVAIVAIIFSMGKSITKIKEREKTRRELAAYIAEGSMTPEDAERLMKASPKDD